MTWPLDAPVPGSDSPIYIWTAAVIGALVIVAAAAPKILGGFSDAWATVVAGRRRTASASRNADLDALAAQVDQVQGVLEETSRELTSTRSELRAFRDETRRYQDQHDEVLSTHAQWDQAMIRALIEAGGQPIPKPPLWPPAKPRDLPSDGGYSDIDHP